MPKTSRPTSNKRAREKAQIERNQEKQKRRMERRERKATAGPKGIGDEDPDIAGIRPGPQPRDPAWLDYPEESAEDEESDEAR
jgi:hypothetical protein